MAHEYQVSGHSIEIFDADDQMDHDADPLALTPNDYHGRFCVLIDGEVVVRGTLDPSLIAAIVAHPGSYVADSNAVRFEVWVEPQGWNEGFEIASNAPLFTFFLSGMQDAATVAALMKGYPSHSSYTGYRFESHPGSSQVTFTSPVAAANTVKDFLQAGGLNEYQP